MKSAPGEDFQECVGELIDNSIVAAIMKAPLLSSSIDTSIDICISNN